MPLTGEVSDLEFKLMLIGDAIALSTIFAVLIFTVHFILVKFKPSWFYHKKRKNEDIDVSQMVRRMSTKFKHLVNLESPPLGKGISLGGKRVSRQVSFGGVETGGEKGEAIYEELTPKSAQAKKFAQFDYGVEIFV